MLELKGRYGKAKVFTDNIDNTSISQIIEILNTESITKNQKIRIMPDVHAGKGSVIGFTSTYKDSVVPNIVGVDIGCGVTAVNIGNEVIMDDNLFKKIDHAILKEKRIPLGFESNTDINPEIKNLNLDKLRMRNNIKKDSMLHIQKSLGSLGGGNHFIEINKASNGDVFLVVHSGSRNLGVQVAKYYQSVAEKDLVESKEEAQHIIIKLKKEGREKDIEKELKEMYKRNREKKINKDLAHISGEDLQDYIHDIDIVQKYASMNRKIIIEKLLGIIFNKKTDINKFQIIESIHNYIDLNNKIIRKGAISAKKDELVIVPINMRDGSIIGMGKGNKDWNYSAPHGAGRIMSRGEAKSVVDIDEFKVSMKGIHSSTVSKNTLDESPFAYKDMDEIVRNTGETFEVIDVIKPIYNIKG